MKCDSITLLLNRVQAICAVLYIKQTTLASELGVHRSQVTRWLVNRETQPTGETVMKLNAWCEAKKKTLVKQRRYQDYILALGGITH